MKRKSILLAAFVALCGILPAGAQLRIYVDQLRTTVRENVNYGWDLGSGAAVSSLTPDAFPTMAELVAADSWDFSGVSGTVEIASTSAPINADETCNWERCGYNPAPGFPGRTLSREDKDFDNANWAITNAVEEVEDRSPADVTIWVRAGALNEGKDGGLLDGESRFCYADDDGQDRTEVPLWRFASQDADGWYMQPGDRWESPPFRCEEGVYNQVCGGPGIFDRLWVEGGGANCGNHRGTQSGEVLKEGVVTLPSGHSFDALLARTVADFCVYLTSGCAGLFRVAEVRTVVYLWQVPHIGTVVRLTSEQLAPADFVSFGVLDETDVKFGLFPPLSIQVDGATDTTVDLSWDPGRVTHRVDGYRVYWDTDSGADSAYAFDSESNAGQVAFNGTAATITGLDPQTTYHFTVTAFSDFTNPSSGVLTRFESLRFPKQVTGPGVAYPVEVQATTAGGACPATELVTDVTAAKVSGETRLCWRAVSDPCLVGYRVLGADTPERPGSDFRPVADTGFETCWTGAPTETFFLLAARGGTGDGPWGHYGR